MIKKSYDLDGTIVEFYEYYKSIFGEPKSDSDITKNVMGILKTDKKFWLNQPLINIPKEVHCYCTARVINKSWIKEQLFLNNLPKAPVYQVFGYKLSKYTQLIRSRADVHIDDSLSVFKDLNLRGFPCLLLDSPNNREWGPIGRVFSLDKDEIDETYHLFKNTMFPHFRELVNG